MTTNGGHVRNQLTRAYTLPEEEVTRLRRLAESHDLGSIRAELESLFLGELPPRREMLSFQEAAKAWIGNGIRALRAGGRQGLRGYVPEVGELLARYRRQGDQGRVRRFINMFGYECKLAFYLCHTSAWAGLVQKLAAAGELNAVGERFMRLWHNQNQVVEDDSEGPGEHRDVFCGQVLSLHPLSAIVQTDAIYLARIGQWLAHPHYEELCRDNRVALCPAYWDVVAVVLEAAHEYQHARRHWESTRGGRAYIDAGAVERATDDASALEYTQTDLTASPQMLFEGYATRQELSCGTCRKSLSYIRHDAPDDQERVVVHYRCESGHCTSIPVTFEALEESVHQ